MIIGIDGYEANVAGRVGVGRYAYEILKHMFQEVKSSAFAKATADKQKSNLELRIYLPDEPLSDLPQETEWWKYIVAGPKKLWTFVGLPLAIAAGKRPDVFFSPTHYIPRFVNIPRVFSVMDLSYFNYPEMFKAKDLHQLVSWTKYSVIHAKKIITISEFSKDAIIKAYGVPERKVVVTYPGLSNHKSQITMTKQNKISKYQISPHYILSVGTLQPRKNFVRLIEAFSKCLSILISKYPSISLVIVGKKGWLYEEILATPSKLRISDRVRFLDFVPDEDLPVLYAESLCFALPSLYEGFGLPVLEAMAYKTPVVISDTSSLPEIARKAGIYVKPDSVDSIAEGLIKAVKEKGSAAEKKRIELGLEQTKKFTWEKAAKKTLEILEEVGKGKI